ncbi:MAG: redoxin domain-containing protein [Gemmatimonadota bacterium]|jgi:peroxiredoxin
MALGPGDRAPDFSLPPAPGPEKISLSQHRGEHNVVLLFLPLAYSSVCTDEVCRVAEDLGAWSDLDAVVLGLSVDSPFVTARFAEDTGAGFPILSDFNKEAMTAYGVVYDDFFGLKGVAKRSAFVVDKAGVIRYAWVTDDSAELPDLAAIRTALEGLD